MADTAGQADIRGIDINRLAKGFAEEMSVLKKFVTVAKTKNREIRWYSKTAGFLTGPATTGITASQIPNVAERSLPFVTGPQWTRNTSYVRKYMVESETISEEDIRDSDIDILATNVRDLVRAVANQVDIRIYNVISESLSPSNINTAAAVGTGWDDTTNGDPVKDILIAKKNIRTFSYNPEGGVLYIHPTEEQMLLTWLITTKGSSIPQYSSQKVKDGTVMEILGLNVVVSANATTDYALVFVRNQAATWKSFMPMSAVVMKDPGIGRKVRVWEEGECLLTDPKAVHLITDTTT